MAENQSNEVNVSKVAKCVANIGQFGLFEIDALNLVVTQWFLLSVNDEQFWKIQCKLEAPHRNTWLYKSKDGINACVGSIANEIIDIYDKAVNSPRGELKRTGLIYGGLDLWTDDTRYMGIRISHLDMIPHQAVIQK